MWVCDLFTGQARVRFLCVLCNSVKKMWLFQNQEEKDSQKYQQKFQHCAFQKSETLRVTEREPVFRRAKNSSLNQDRNHSQVQTHHELSWEESSSDLEVVKWATGCTLVRFAYFFCFCQTVIYRRDDRREQKYEMITSVVFDLCFQLTKQILTPWFSSSVITTLYILAYTQDVTVFLD